MARKLLILFADAGFGHRRAAEALKVAFEELYPDDEVVLENPFKDPELPDLARQVEASYDEVVVDDPELWDLAYSATDSPLFAQLLQTISEAVLTGVIKRMIEKHSPDAVIATHFSFGGSTALAIQSLGLDIITHVVITDLVDVHHYWFDKKVDYTYTPTGFVYRQGLDLGFDKTKLRLLGLPVHPAIVREKRSKEDIRKALGWKGESLTALVVGSARTTNETNIVSLLDRAGLDLQIAVVAGGNSKTESELNTQSWRGDVHVYGFVENLPEMMHAADFIICKAGGLITTESLACGLPLIYHEALPGQEDGNVKYVVEGGAGVFAKGAKGVLAEVITWLMKDAEKFKRMRAGAKRLGKPNAAYDIVKAVMKSS